MDILPNLGTEEPQPPAAEPEAGAGAQDKHQATRRPEYPEQFFTGGVFYGPSVGFNCCLFHKVLIRNRFVRFWNHLHSVIDAHWFGSAIRQPFVDLRHSLTDRLPRKRALDQPPGGGTHGLALIRRHACENR